MAGGSGNKTNPLTGGMGGWGGLGGVSGYGGPAVDPFMATPMTTRIGGQGNAGQAGGGVQGGGGGGMPRGNFGMPTQDRFQMGGGGGGGQMTPQQMQMQQRMSQFPNPGGVHAGRAGCGDDDGWSRHALRHELPRHEPARQSPARKFLVWHEPKPDACATKTPSGDWSAGAC